MGQSVPIVKDKTSRDSMIRLLQNRSMADKNTPKRYNADFIARTIELRDGAGITKQDMARALDVEYEAYKKYENRSPLPHHLIPRFAIITGAYVEYLVSGNGPKWLPARKSA